MVHHSPALTPAIDRDLLALTQRFTLDAAAHQQLRQLLLLLGEQTAPTSIHDPFEALRVHLADSLVALELTELSEPGRVADIGAGAGLPGLVLAVARPAARFTLVEATARKCEFIARCVAKLELTNVEVVCARAEAWRAGLGSNDLICARALAALPVLCEYAAPLLVRGGHLVAWKTTLTATEAADTDAAVRILGLERARIADVVPYEGSRDRRLYLYRKVADTPDRFPRRPGVAVKRPLSSNS